ncbi:MAG: asparaginase [Deltaproteobacteria bacterium]|nr:asparaginase [Deltaproteobacteria bacterium]
MYLKIFAVGGTIDKIYFDAKNTYQVGQPNVAAVLKDLRLGFDYTIESLLKKDSLDLTDDDRRKIHDAISNHNTDKIIVTHGTDTMVDTAKVLSDIKDKTIVLTGALEPALFRTSDAVFNIGFAIAAVQILSRGVYICMNGRVFNFDNVRKNTEKGIFEELMPQPQE